MLTKPRTHVWRRPSLGNLMARLTRTPILGIDIGSSAIKLAVVSRSGGQPI